MEQTVVERRIGRHTLRLETGRLARQAAGCVVVRYADTVVLAAVVVGPPREGIDFFPLTVDYREKTYAAGKIPGGFFKREARPTQKEVLTMRAIDRPMRPLFPKGYHDEVLIQAMCLSTDQENDPDVLAQIGAAAAVSISSVPFDGPVASVRVGLVDDEYVLMPTLSELEFSPLEMILSGHRDGLNMIEVAANELPEETVLGAIEFGHAAIREICDMIQELQDRAGKQKVWIDPAPDTDALMERLRQRVSGPLREARRIAGKQERNNAINEIYKAVLDELAPRDAVNPEFSRNTIRECIDKIEEGIVRDMVLYENIRSDGRGLTEIRPITCEVGVLPRVHGSALFQRGETQSLVTVTLGTGRDEQIVDGLTEEYSKKFMLHYNFPPLCTGEVKRVGAVSRREIGHGALAEKSLETILPSPEDFPYTIRVVSEIMESNGSSSMASVCGGTLALMDAGVPIRQPVAGISIGLFRDDKSHKLVVDILGEEDHFGDMDFKVAGTQRGVTGIQLDLKTRGLTMDIIEETFKAARQARLDILRKMLSTIKAPRPQISEYAPRILTMKIDPDKIGKVIGPGGKGIRALEADTGARIEIESDGTILISCLEMQGAEAAKAAIEAMTESVQVGRIYVGKVISTKDFGAFIEVAPGQDGLCHISELSDEYVRSVGDVCQIGDVLKVKVIAVDDQGRVKLSRKAVLLEERQQAGAGAGA
ncbi:MAG: polyribonucleotide nucleotidyltransferase [Phycisphaerales bacterium]|nr:MAG: polyribonucleotide nucleotidyltransferase [Phycisphaerales bacterium]